MVWRAGRGNPPGYRSLMRWLTSVNNTPTEMLEGLVVFGEPATDPDPEYDRVMRARFPPHPLPAFP